MDDKYDALIPPAVHISFVSPHLRFKYSIRAKRNLFAGVPAQAQILLQPYQALGMSVHARVEMLGHRDDWQALQVRAELHGGMRSDGDRCLWRFHARYAVQDPKKAAMQLPHLTVLRAGNQLLRRLSRTSHAQLRGQVHLFLAKWCPLSDKSAVNMFGNVNTAHSTVVEDLPEVSTLLCLQSATHAVLPP